MKPKTRKTGSSGPRKPGSDSRKSYRKSERSEGSSSRSSASRNSGRKAPHKPDDSRSRRRPPASQEESPRRESTRKEFTRREKQHPGSLKPEPAETKEMKKRSSVDKLFQTFQGEKLPEDVFFPCRINRYLASCGLGSRRQVEEYVLQGRVTLNGKKIENLNAKVKEEDIVLFDGRRAKLPGVKLYYAMNKPRGYTVTKRRFKNEKSIYDILPAELSELKYAGRLDKESRGLLVFSNDGQFISAVTHPSRRLTKKYLVTVDGTVDEKQLAREFYRGIRDEGELLKAVSVRVIDRDKKIIEVSLNEGKKRQIRRMFKALNLKVVDLFRISVGFLSIESLKLKDGEVRSFSPDALLLGGSGEETVLGDFNPWSGS